LFKQHSYLNAAHGEEVLAQHSPLSGANSQQPTANSRAVYSQRLVIYRVMHTMFGRCARSDEYCGDFLHCLLCVCQEAVAF